MNRTALAVLFALFSSASLAQTRVSLTGSVVDSTSRDPLERATVAILAETDSSLVSYTITNRAGGFVLRNLPSGKRFKVIISHVGYANFRARVLLHDLNATHLGTISLARNAGLAEVVIRGSRPPVSIRQDTIEFSAEAFKTRPNAVVEELLKKLPGVQVDAGGTILVNGKNISRVLVDGKAFFGNDYRIATRNLDADMIDKVQVMDDREDDPDRLKDASQVDQMINLKLRKSYRRSTFGKLYGGLSATNRFETGGILNTLRDTLQVSVVAFGNNVNQGGFSANDLSTLGGFRRSGTSPAEVNAGLAGYGLQKNLSAGVNLNNDWGKKAKATLLYFYGNTRTVSGSTFRAAQVFPGAELHTTGADDREQVQHKHTLSGKVQWNISPESNLRFGPTLTVLNNTYTTSSSSLGSNAMQPLNENRGSSRQQGNQWSYNHTLAGYRRLKKKGETVSLTHTLQFAPSGSTGRSLVNSLIYASPTLSEARNLEALRQSSRSSIHVEATYRRPLGSKALADLVAGGGYDQLGEELGTFEFNELTGRYDRFLPTQSNHLTRHMFAYRLRPGITWNIRKDLSLVAGLTSQVQAIKNSFGAAYARLSRHHFFLLPSARLTAKNFTASYDLRVNQPATASLQPIVDVSNPLHTRSGNPQLQPEQLSTFNASYKSYDTDRLLSLSLSLNGTLAANSQAENLSVNPATGVLHSFPVNVDGNYSVNLGLFVNKQWRKAGNWQLSMNSGGGSYLTRSHYLLNNEHGQRDTKVYYLSQGLTLNWNDRLDFQPSYNGFFTGSRSAPGSAAGFRSTKHELAAQFTLRGAGKLTAEGSYLYRYNSQANTPAGRRINLVNASLARALMKNDRGQLKLSVYDLLNQNTGVDSYAFDNTTRDSANKVLRQYVMLGFSYNFKPAVGK